MSLAAVAVTTLIPVVAAGAGGLVTVYRPPGAVGRSALQHVAAGVIVAAVAVEVLPPVRAQPVAVALIGVGAGIVVMVAVRVVEERLTQRRSRGEGSPGLLVAVGADLLIDGLVVGTGFAMGSRQGVLLTLALTLEVLFLGLSLPEARRGPRWLPVAQPMALALLLPTGAVLGDVVLGGVSAGIRATVFAFGAVVLLYLVTEELLVEAHAAAMTRWAPSLFFLGFLLYLVIADVLP